MKVTAYQCVTVSPKQKHRARLAFGESDCFETGTDATVTKERWETRGGADEGRLFCEAVYRTKRLRKFSQVKYLYGDKHVCVSKLAIDI